MQNLKNLLYTFLRKSERYTKTDMIYLTKTGWWINLGTVIISALSLVLYMVFARTLSLEVYGTYQYLLSGGALFGALTLTGMNGAIARAVARGHDRTLYTATQAQLRWSVVPLGVAFVVAGYYLFQGNTTLGIGFALIGITTPLIGIFGSYASFLQGKKDFRRSFWYGMFWNVSYYVGLILVSFFYPTTLWLIVASFGVQVIALGVVYFKTIRTYLPKEDPDVESISYGRHLSIMNFGTVVASQIDTIITFHLLGPVAVAVYSFATAIPERLSGFFKFLPAAALPKFASKTAEEMKGAFGPRILIAIIGMLLVAGVYALFAPLVFSILFPTYTESVPYSQVYALVLLTSISGLFTSALIAQRNVKSLYVHTAVSPIMQVVLQFVGALLYGLWGLIVARLASQFLSALLAYIILKRVVVS
jgi:O-antigen/teichoic acid export membrane protein